VEGGFLVLLEPIPVQVQYAADATLISEMGGRRASGVYSSMVCLIVALASGTVAPSQSIHHQNRPVNPWDSDLVVHAEFGKPVLISHFLAQFVGALI
jgi:hypothetical protein